MSSFNKVLLMGNLTRDPEMRYTQGGSAVVKFGMAVNRRYRNQQTQEQVEETTFIDVEGWGRQAETFNQYMSTGRPIFIEGRLRFDSWEGKDGQKRSKLLVVMENFRFIGGASGANRGEAPRENAGPDSGRARQEQPSVVPGGSGSGGAGAVSDGGPPPGQDYDFDDIPF